MAEQTEDFMHQRYSAKPGMVTDVTADAAVDIPSRLTNRHYLSPFRYPGGKTWLVPDALRWMQASGARRLIEPFAGGASVGLSAARWGVADEVLLVELDPLVAAVWSTALGPECERLCQRILAFDPVDRASVVEVLSADDPDPVEVAFRTLLRNRTSRGGLITCGSGLLRSGENGRGLASRWYPQTLVTRLRTIHGLARKVRFVHGDGLAAYAELAQNSSWACFADPPYSVGDGPGDRLYNCHDLDHDRLFDLAGSAAGPVMLTYHDDPAVRSRAAAVGLSVAEKVMRTTHHSRKVELLISRPPAKCFGYPAACEASLTDSSKEPR